MSHLCTAGGRRRCSCSVSARRYCTSVVVSPTSPQSVLQMVAGPAPAAASAQELGLERPPRTHVGPWPAKKLELRPAQKKVPIGMAHLLHGQGASERYEFHFAFCGGFSQFSIFDVFRKSRKNVCMSVSLRNSPQSLRERRGKQLNNRLAKFPRRCWRAR